VALVFTPLLAQKRLGRVNTLGLTIVFCLSSVLITISRTAGGPSLAALGIVSILMLVIGAETDTCLQKRLPWIAGILGFTLATGIDALHGILTIFLAGFFFSFQNTAFAPFVNTMKLAHFRKYLWITLVVWLAAVSGLGFSLGGFIGMAESIGTWFSSWFTPGRLPGITSILLMPIYDPLITLFGLAGIISAVRKSDWLGRSVAAWAIAAFIINLLYLAREPRDLIWVTLPLAILASGQLIKLIHRIVNQNYWLDFLMIFGVLVSIFAYDVFLLKAYGSGMKLGGLISIIGFEFYPLVAIGILLLAALIVVFFAFAWDVDVALTGTGSAMATFLFLFTISSVWYLNFLKPSAGELWRPQATTIGVNTLQSSLELVSEFSAGRDDALSLQLIDADNHADVAWAMREMPRVSDEQDGFFTPDLILTPEELSISAYSGQYIGQSIVLGERWAWSGLIPPDIFKWWVTREAPVFKDYWLLLVRADLVPIEMDIVSEAESE
jgi:hypothetical protein